MPTKEGETSILLRKQNTDTGIIELSPQDIGQYLEGIGYKIKERHTIDTAGATDCVYMGCSLDNGDERFIKVGEKVDKEVSNIEKLRNRGVRSIPPLYEGSNSDRRILITELLPNPNAGYESVKRLYEGEISTAEFLELQNKSFEALHEFYQITVDRKEDYSSQMFDVRTQQRMADLLAERHLVIPARFLHSQGDVMLDTLLNKPIEYQKKRASVFNAPSVIDMHKNFVDVITMIPQIKPKVIHGDFHAPNIALTNDNEVCIIDISDVRFGEDPTWDLGKWLNYFNRFYRASEIRASEQADPLVKFSLGEKVVLEDSADVRIEKSSIEEINTQAVENFAKMIDEDEQIIALRSAAAEFAVNISTLRRHAIGYPQTVKNVLACICESYIHFKDKCDEISI